MKGHFGHSNSKAHLVAKGGAVNSAAGIDRSSIVFVQQKQCKTVEPQSKSCIFSSVR